MELTHILDEQFEEDILRLKRESPKLVSKVGKLINSITENPKDPYYGLGHPEALTGDLAGYFSRHINLRHRLIYKVDLENSTLYLLSCFNHYGDK